MGGELLSAFLQILFQAVYKLLQDELNLQRGLQQEWRKLIHTVSVIQCFLREAEERQHDDGSLRQWLNGLRNVVYDALDVLDDVAYETQRQQLVRMKQIRDALALVNPKRAIVRHTIADKIQDIHQRLDDLQKMAVTLGLSRGASGRNGAEDHELHTSTSLPPPVVHGRDNDKRRILEMLLRFDRNTEISVTVIPIVGMCGVGKTTLAQLVYNDDAVENHFQPRLWVDVTHNFNVRRLTKAIIKSIDSPATDHINMDCLQKQLQEKIRGRRYLLVLDNVWTEKTEEWGKLMLPLLYGAQGSTILVTTRSKGVAKVVGTTTTSPYNLKCLSDDDCWTLFCQRAVGKNLYRHSDMDDIAKEILKRCKGLPLAAISIGNQLRMENDRRKWISILKSNTLEVSGYDSDFVMSISLSYQQLPAHLKPCFAYCSIIPKGFEFEKEFIVHLWMAQNLVQTEEERAEDKVSLFFDFLVQRSLFELSQYDDRRGKHRYRMPDVVHDLAQRVSAQECSIVEIGKQCNTTTRHLSLTYSQFESNEELQSGSPAHSDIFDKIYRCNGLHTLLLVGGHNFHDLKVPKTLPKKLKFLRTLDLSNCKLKVLPESIKKLRHLRCLQLRDTNISSLPESIGELYNLQILGLRNCYSLEELPSGTKNLLKLRHLDLHLDQGSVEAMSKLRSIPPEIGVLTDLQTLSRFVVGIKEGCGIGELKDLNSLHGELIISNLHLVQNAEEAQKANLTGKKYIQNLQLHWSMSGSASRGVRDDKSILSFLKPHTNLEELKLLGYKDSSFPSWLSDSAFTNLTILCLSHCNNCESLPALGRLPMLQELQIIGMEKLEVVDCTFFCKRDGTIPNFPKLDRLVFEDMPSLKIWDDCVLHSLSQLVIKNCVNLERFIHDLPSLSMLKIEGCPKLIGLRRFPSLMSLDVASIGHWIWGCRRYLTTLTSITLSSLSIETFPDNWLPVGLVCLNIQQCKQLKCLPELTNLSSLDNMEILDCPGILFLPRNGLPTTLKFLRIKDCPILSQRCQDEKGEDWRKLAYVCSMWINDQLVISRSQTQI
ncbi:disease resistance protein RGA3 [Canna indica]|uniref:Disease resistance protein RGA3 n=1 Tax=Canna indica TaxID=4628 RepID=A0AAQ3KEM5_9LILI|nr:disease resistance protein RGA3 [Canna indica]